MGVWRKPIYLLVAILIIFLIVKVPFIDYKLSDENTYFYMADIVLDGEVPYRDFFFASPPLQVYLMAFILIFGKVFLFLKFIPIICAIISCYLVYLIIKKNFNEIEAFIGSVLYLFSFAVLTTTDHNTGVHLSALFILFMIYFAYEDRFFLAGIFGSLALLTRLYSPMPIIALGLWILLFKRKEIFKFATGVLSIFGITSLFFYIISKGAYLQQIIGFRLNLIGMTGIPKLQMFAFFIRWDWLLVLGSLFFIFTQQKKKYALITLVVGFLAVFYLFYQDSYYLYLVLIIPYLAILTAHSIMHFRKLKYFRYGILVLLIVLVTYNSAFFVRDHANTSKIDQLDDIVEFVRGSSAPDETLYGSFEITPLISILSGRKITHNFVDTNDKNFLTGIFDIKNRSSIIRSDIKYIIGAVLVDENGQILQIGAFADVEFLSGCDIVHTSIITRDYGNNAIVIWDCDLYR